MRITDRATIADAATQQSRHWGRRGTAAVSIASGLSFDNVRHAYGRQVSLSGINFTVRPGEVICVLGRSGCGKSTLLRLAAGLERPIAGSVSIDGKTVSDRTTFLPPEKRGIGFVFQDYALFPHLTILDNVTFGLTRLSGGVARAEALKALTRVGMVAYAKAYPHQLSGGEQQRVALARAIAPRPGILLMDEPFSGLDRRLRDEVREETMAVLRETGATSMIVTHDPEEAMQMADRIILMRRGHIAQMGTARALYHQPGDEEIARFFSETNLIEGQGGAGCVETLFGQVCHPDAVVGATYMVGIRPYGLSVQRPGENADGVPGRVVARRFIGEIDLIEVAVEGLEQPLLARSRLDDDIGPGGDVRVSLDRRGILIFDPK